MKKMGFALHFTAMTIALFMCMCARLGPKLLFDVEDEVELRESHGFKMKDLA